MHLAVVTGCYRSGSGVGTSVREWVVHLAREGFTISVLAPDVEDGLWNGRVRFWRIPDVRLLPQVVPCLFKLWLTHFQDRIDAVHVHDSMLFAACYAFGKLARIPTVFTFHASVFSGNRRMDYGRITTCVLKLANRFAARGADRLVCVSSEMVQCAVTAGASRDKLVLLHNPVDLSLFEAPHHIGSRTKTCLYVGALRPTKGVRYLIASIPAVLRQMNDAKFLIIGAGPEREDLEKLSQQLGVDGAVDFLGHLDRHELVKYYQQATLLVLPSLDEPQGIVCLEAMACGLPVVASNVGGIPDMVRDGANGLLVPPGEPDALARAILKLLSSRDLYAECSASALRTVESFSWDRNVGACVDLFRSLLGEAVPI